MLLVPKHQTRQGNKSHIIGGKNDKKEKRRHGFRKQQQKKNKQKEPLQNNAAQIVLQPRKQAAQPVASNALKLEATIHTNEKGEKMLKLTKESSEMVDNAMKMEETSDTASDAEDTILEEDEPQQVLFYDPDDLKTDPGGIPLPRKVFDADGNEVDMGGKDAILVPPPPPHDPEHEPPKPPPPPEEEADETSTSSSTESTSSSSYSQETSQVQTPQTQDQMIIISTVATMALFVGALSARRLRSRQFLSFCIENESLEDELAYDVAYTTQSTVGASSFYTGAGYDTFGSGGKYGGDLRWRGDLEKFDV